MTPRRVTIVVLCWNRWELTQRCLETLRETTELADVDVLAVDNGSSDATPERLKSYPWLRVVTLHRNLGFVRGNNAGIAAADPESDVVLLNNDLEIHQPGWLEALKRAAYGEPDVGIVGCRLVFPGGKLLHAGTFILPETFWGQQIGSLETDVNQYSRTREVQGIVFAVAYIRREVLRALGGLSEAFTSYFEDTDYCLRAAEAGFKTICCGGVTITHVQHGSTSDAPESFNQLFETSRATFRKLWKEKLESRYDLEMHWQSILNFPTGYAMSARALLKRLDCDGVKVSYEYVYGPGTPHPALEPPNTGDYYLNVLAGRRRRRPEVSVVYAVADVFDKNRGRYKVGYTMLEVDGFPEEWVRLGNRMDEVWVPSTANRDAYVLCGLKRPVHVMPLGVDLDHFHPGIRGFPNPHGLFVFLSVLEWGERKAPGLLLKTFNQAFRSDEPVVLVCKIINVNKTTDVRRQIEALSLSSNGGQIAFLHNKELPYHELGALYRSADCYVSASRGEGWDLPLMEAMACGLPSIATDWGAHRDFVHEGVSYPLAARGTVKAEASCPYYEGFSWAAPDPEHLRTLLRHVYEHREEAGAKGRRAAMEVESQWSVECAAGRIRARLLEVGEERRGSRPQRAEPIFDGRPVVAVDVSRAIGEEISGIGRYTQNLVTGLGRHGPEDLRFLLLPGLGSYVHPAYDRDFHYDAPAGRNLDVYRGALPAYAHGRVPGVRLLHSTAWMVPEADGVPLVATVHDLSFLSHPELHTRENIEFCRRNLEKARTRGAFFVAVSEATREDLLARLQITPERVVVIPNAVDLRVFHPRPAEEIARVRGEYRLPSDFFLS